MHVTNELNVLKRKFEGEFLTFGRVPEETAVLLLSFLVIRVLNSRHYLLSLRINLLSLLMMVILQQLAAPRNLVEVW